MAFKIFSFGKKEGQSQAPPPLAQNMGDKEELRYSRQLILPEIGKAGQEKLRQAKVLIIGLGGLGNIAASFLAGSGVGKLGLVDSDKVELNNLHRQPLYSKEDIGKSKVLAAKAKLLSLNSDIQVETYEIKLTSQNAMSILQNYDLILDCSDNFPTRYLINDACVLLKKPDIYGAAVEFDGQASVFDSEKGPCYRCFFAKPPHPNEVKSCAEAGVLGTVPALIGTIQAAEAIKLIIGKGETLIGKLFLFNSFENKFEVANLKKNPACELCGQNPTIKNLIDYEEFCGLKERSKAEPEGREIDPSGLKQKLDSGEKLVLLDVREDFERTICKFPNAVHIPVGQITHRYAELNPNDQIIAHCHKGGRSAYTTEFLIEKGFKNVKNLRGGIDAWANEIDPSMQKY